MTDKDANGVDMTAASETSLRPATPEDADAIAAVFSPSLRLLDFLPALHTVAEDRWFIENVILVTCAVTVAERDGRLVGFLALDGSEVRLLYVHPESIGTGIGGALIEHAKSLPALELWCFQANTRARRFYEAHGFVAVEFTDGTRNEERTPDVRYRWNRAGPRNLTRKR